MPKTVEYELRNSKIRPRTSFLKDFLQNLAFLAYFRPWDPSHWIRSVFLIHLGTGNAAIHENKVIFTFFQARSLLFFWNLKPYCLEMWFSIRKKVRIPTSHPYLAPVSWNLLYSNTAFSTNTALDSGSLRGEFKPLSSSRSLV